MTRRIGQSLAHISSKCSCTTSPSPVGFNVSCTILVLLGQTNVIANARANPGGRLRTWSAPCRESFGARAAWPHWCLIRGLAHSSMISKFLRLRLEVRLAATKFADAKTVGYANWCSSKANLLEGTALDGNTRNLHGILRTMTPRKHKSDFRLADSDGVPAGNYNGERRLVGQPFSENLDADPLTSMGSLTTKGSPNRRDHISYRCRPGHLDASIPS